MAKGTRFIGGKEFLLAGREVSKFDAQVARIDLLRSDWERVRIIKLSDWDYMLYAHGRISK